MPRKNGKGNGKGNKNGRKKSDPVQKSNTALVKSLQIKLLTLNKKYHAVTSLVVGTIVENESLEEQILKAKEERKKYIDYSKKYVDGIKAQLAGLKVIGVRKVKETERNKEATLTRLNKAHNKLIGQCKDKAMQRHILSKKLADMRTYKDTEQKQRESLEEMTVGLEALMKQHQSEAQDFIRGLLRERKSWYRMIRLDQIALSKEADKTTKPMLDRELQRIHDGNPGLKAQLLEVSRKRVSMEGMKDQLAKLMISLDLEEQYWSDLKAIHYRRPFHKVANVPSESISFTRSHEDQSKSDKSASPMTVTAASRRNRDFLGSMNHVPMSFAAILLMNSNILRSREDESDSCDSHTI